MSESIAKTEIEPSALERMLRIRAPGISEEKRLRMLGEIEAACAGMTVEVRDLRASFDVPVRIFLDHVADGALITLHSALRQIATRLSGHAGRTEEALFVARLGELQHEIIDKIEQRFADVVVERGQLAVDLVVCDASDNSSDSGSVAGRGDLLDDPLRKTCERPVGRSELRRSVSCSVQKKTPAEKAVRRRPKS